MSIRNLFFKANNSSNPSGNYNTALSTIDRIKTYFIIQILFLLIGSGLLIWKGYIGSFLFVNSFHRPFFDAIMPHLTHLGDSLILASLVLLICSRFNPALAITIVVSIIISGILLLCFKHFLFPDWHRPLTVIGEGKGIHYIKGHVEYFNAFPSGHSTTIGSAFVLLALFFRKKWMQIVIALTSVLICYTRIYLGSHFLGDVIAGNLLGTTVSIFTLLLFYPSVQNYLWNKYKNDQRRIIGYAFIIGFTGLLTGLCIRYLPLGIIFENVKEIDRDLFLFLNGFHNSFMDEVMFWISGKYSWVPFYFLLLALIVYNFRYRAIPIILLIVLLIVLTDFTASGIFKPIFQRLRPSHNPELEGLVHIVNEYRGGTFGFISSHACNVFGLAFYFLFTLNTRLPWLKYIMFPWAILVSYSRIYLGVHYPGDILVPVILSYPIAFAVHYLYKKIENRFYKEEII